MTRKATLVRPGSASSAAAAVAAVGGAVAVAGAPIVGAVTPTGAPGTVFAPSLRLGDHANIRQSASARRMKRHWFLNRNDADLVNITDEEENASLGIVKLTLEAPTPKQADAGIVCKVSMESLTGMDFGITVWESKNDPGDIYISTQGRDVTMIRKGVSTTETVRDRRINDATQAQILSFVWKHIVPKTIVPGVPQ